MFETGDSGGDVGKRTTMIRIALADDHNVVRQGLRALLEGVKDFRVVGEARDGKEVVELVTREKPDVAVVDLAMPSLNGVEATRRIVRDLPQVKVLVLSMYTGEEYVREALAAGASGYLVKDSAADDLVEAIRAVAKGGEFLSPAIAHLAQGRGAGTPLDRLTSREREVLQLIAEGNSNKEIAARLTLSVKTIEAHRTNLMSKLDIHDTASLTRFAIARGLVRTE
jgi:DNA-binding NarL/FixJ family response regulator